MKKLYHIPYTTYHIPRLGFTLVELIVVITIIGILAGFGFTNYNTSQKRARDGKRKADLEQVRSALEMCRTDTGSYPGNLSAIWGTYMNQPTDPKGFAFNYSSGGQTYALWICLEVSDDPDGVAEGSCTSGKKYQVQNP